VNLILIEADEVNEDGVATLTDVRADHARSVLRVTPGAVIRVGIVNGPMGTAEVLSVGPFRISTKSFRAAATPERPRVDLLLALPRPKVMRRLWAQLAALGVGRIILTNAGKVERDYFDTHLLQPEVYRPLLLEGLQQARDTRLPEISVHKQFRKLVEDELDRIEPWGRRIVTDPSATSTVRAALAGASHSDRVLLAVGPEGGWSDFERDLLAGHGFMEASAGDRVLATTTACVALLTLAHDALREDRER
jgi:16S rRNA (uracil1498-N3)-methyltransferase